MFSNFVSYINIEYISNFYPFSSNITLINHPLFKKKFLNIKNTSFLLAFDEIIDVVDDFLEYFLFLLCRETIEAVKFGESYELLWVKSFGGNV